MPATNNKKGSHVMMMFPVAMIKGIGPDAEGQQNHTSFKSQVMNNVDTKQR